jgi:hypothetical protein
VCSETTVKTIDGNLFLIQGKKDDALALELKYIEQTKLEPFSTAYRRGQVFEQYKHLKEAADAYEAADSNYGRAFARSTKGTSGKYLSRAIAIFVSTASRRCLNQGAKSRSWLC